MGLFNSVQDKLFLKTKTARVAKCQNMEVTGKDTNGDRKPQHLDPLFKDGNNPDEDKGFEHLNKSDICIL